MSSLPAAGYGLMGLGQQGGGNPLYPIGQTEIGQGTDPYSVMNQISQSGGNSAQVMPQQVNPYLTANLGTPIGGQYDQFLTNLYKTQLGRTPDQAGYQYWQSALNSGQTTPQDLLKEFQNSNEYKANQTIRNANALQNPFGLTGANANDLATSTDPFIKAAQQTAMGNYQGATAATAANRVNQSTPYGSLQYTQTGTDINGNPIWSANQTLSPQLQALSDQSLRNLQSSLNNPAYGVNAGETATDAIMRRLQPQIEHQNQLSDQQLANQGIMPGSAAYNRAKTQLAQQQNDLLTSAQTAGINAGLAANQAQNQTAANIRNLSAQNYVNPYTQQAVTGPDYLTGYTAAQKNAVDIQNAQNAANSNLTKGLFDIGGNLVKGGIGQGSLLGGLGSLAGDIIGGIGSVFGF